MTNQFLAFIGTYTTGASEGIYTYRFDAGTGELERLSVIGGISNPSWVEVSPSGRNLYAVGEESHGVIKAYAIDPATGALTYLNEQLTGGQVPCHISVDATEAYVLLANYGSGSVAMLPIQADGSLAPLTGFVQHEGSSIHPVRQLGPHAHSIILDATNRLAFAPDLGIDKLLVYDLDLDNGTLAPHHVPWVRTPAGAGPRHFDFHPNGQFAYLINELGSSISVLRYFADQGVFGEIETVSTLPDDFDGESTCADIHVAPSGRFVYGSNRGHDSIAMFAIRPSHRPPDQPGQRIHPGPNPPQLRHRPLRYLAPRRQPGHQYHRHLPHRPPNRPPPPHRPRNPNPQPRLHQTAAGLNIARVGRISVYVRGARLISRFFSSLTVGG